MDCVRYSRSRSECFQSLFLQPKSVPHVVGYYTSSAGSVLSQHILYISEVDLCWC